MTDVLSLSACVRPKRYNDPCAHRVSLSSMKSRNVITILVCARSSSDGPDHNHSFVVCDRSAMLTAPGRERPKGRHCWCELDLGGTQFR